MNRRSSREIPKGQADRFMEFAEGRMKKKVMGAVEASTKASER